MVIRVQRDAVVLHELYLDARIIFSGIINIPVYLVEHGNAVLFHDSPPVLCTAATFAPAFYEGHIITYAGAAVPAECMSEHLCKTGDAGFFCKPYPLPY